jgi:hypothetical protein
MQGMLETGIPHFILKPPTRRTRMFLAGVQNFAGIWIPAKSMRE